MFTQTDGQIFERTTIFTVRAEQVFLCRIHPQDLTSLLGKGGEELVSRGKLRQWQHSSCNLERGIEHQMFRIDSDWSWTHQSQGAPDPSYFKPLFAPRSSPAHSSPANGDHQSHRLLIMDTAANKRLKNCENGIKWGIPNRTHWTWPGAMCKVSQRWINTAAK